MSTPPPDAAVLGDHAGTIRDLGIATYPEGESALIATISVSPEICLPGTDVVRPSILATLADVACGKFANAATLPRISVTLDLDLSLTHEPSGSGFASDDLLSCRAVILKSGRQVTVTGYELVDGGGRRFGFGHAGFMSSPDPAHVAPDGFPLEASDEGRRLDRPIAERALVERFDDGRAAIPDVIDNVNATSAIQGGLLGLVAEESILASIPDARFRSMSIRYLDAFRRTTAIAAAQVDGGVASVDVVDEQRDRVGAIVVAQLAGGTALAEVAGR